MNRRIFIQTAISSLVLPAGILTTKAAASEDTKFSGDYCFYDNRFPQARQLAGRLSDPATLMPVQSDITEVWNSELDGACRRSPMTMHGVTTESFYFCLKVMMQSRARVETQITRLNRDLHQWTIRANNILITGGRT